MREWLHFHSPTVGAFLALTVVAGALSMAMPVTSVAGEHGSVLAATAIPLPGPGEDADRDSYSDAVDRADGDLQVGVRLLELEVPGRNAEPYVLLGTEDDQWRNGAGAELEWTHVVDPDSLGRKAGSPAWQRDVLRTGAWWMSRPGDGLDIAIAETGSLGAAGVSGAHWPQTMWANVRDDRALVTLDVELRDSSDDPHTLRGTWAIAVDLDLGLARVGEEPWSPLPANLTLEEGDSRLAVQVKASAGPPRATLEAIAARWAPTLLLDSEEAFVPVRGDLLESFHGFTRRGPDDVDLRTWSFDFNAGRDGYRLFLADFDGDGRTGHSDAKQLSDALVCGLVSGNPCVPNDPTAPTVYAQVGVTTDDQVVVQFWFLYFYNFVLDDSGADIEKLQHKGDREFLQMTFDGWEAASNGTPAAIAFSQHYEGLRLDDPQPGAAPLDGGFNVYIARGSHATYPSPGDDRRLRSSITSIFDRFDGKGMVLDPGNYSLEFLGDQAWHAGYKWGPTTRYTRDLGTSARPLLQHDFRYPFTDPLWWQAGLRSAGSDDLEALYGRIP
ncbi:MAG: hypothetical protein AABY18_09540 [Candidatus Thermoplasmatota archaeon]